MMVRKAMLIAAAAAMLVPQAALAQTHPAAALIESLRTLRKHEDRVTAIGERLMVAAAAAGWCEPVQSVGWTLGELGIYPKALRPTVRQHWRLPSDVSLFVSSIAPDGAAARAGIVPGMGIARIGDTVPTRYRGTQAARTALDVSERLVQRQLSDGQLSIELVALDGTRQRVAIAGRPACASRLEVSAEDEEQAYADGETIQVTAAMAHYTRDSDDELAGVIAHELAHNMLRHIPRTEEAGTPNDYTRYLNRYSRISRSMEEEADRLSVWLLAAAGYNPEAPIAFWQRFGPNNDSSHPFGRLHDRWTVRVAAIEDELGKMRAAKAADSAARPTLLDRATVVPVPGQR